MKPKIEHATHSIGIHFERDEIHGVRLRTVRGSTEIEEVASVSFKSFLGDKVSVAALREVLSILAPPKGCTINVTTAFTHFHNTHLSIAEAPLSQLNKLALMAYRQEIKLDDDAFIFDYERLGVNEGAATSKISVHAFSVEASLKETLCEMLEKVGQKNISITPPLFALRNLVDAQNWTTPTALMILDEHEFRVGVVHDHKFIFTRTFKSGLTSFLEYISQKVERKVSVAALKKALDTKSEAFHTQLATEIRSAFSYITERMQQQIERAFKFYIGRLKLPPMERILIHADYPIVAQNMASLMKSHYSQPVSDLNLNRLEIPSWSNFLDHDTGYYALATGAALASSLRCPNLLYTHDDLHTQRKTHRIKTGLFTAISIMAVICISSFVVQVALTTPLVMKKHSLDRQMDMHPVRVSKDVLEAKAQLCERRLGDLKKLSEHYSLQGYFYAISTLMPPELKLEHLQLELIERSEEKDDSGTIGLLEMRGIVVDQGLRQKALLTKFLVELGNSPAFKNISKTAVPESEMTAYSELDVLPFQISCELIYGSAGGIK